MNILVASKNDAKLNGVKIVYENFFENINIEGISVESNVSEQPCNEEIYIGAKNRVKNLIEYAKQNALNIDYYIALESGLICNYGEWQNITLCLIQDNFNNYSFGTSAGFPVPSEFVKEIQQKSLSGFFAEHFNKNKTEKVKGGISFLTKDKVNRVELCYQAVTMALTQFLNEEWNNFNTK